MLRRTLVPLILTLFAVPLSLLLAEKPVSGATTLPQNFSDSAFVSGLSKPTAMAFAPDDRLFVAEQGGNLRVVKSGKLLSTPFINLTSVTDSTGERGLLGVALDPDFSTNKYVYVYHTLKATSTSPARNRVLRFTANGDTFTPRSGKVILDLNNLSARNHNGGAIHFGKDGKLYVAVGDNAVGNNAQSLANLHGKILRINKDGTIPTDNPFYSHSFVSGKNKAIWALGLRNPYSFAIQPGTGRMYINDVGARYWEEINVGARGANYGWPVFEGPENYSKYASPIFWYGHGGTATTGCAITGGAFYNPTRVQFPADYAGDYFFADYCSGWIRKYDSATRTASGFATGLPYPVDLQVGSDGSLYYLARGSTTGFVGKIQYGS